MMIDVKGLQSQTFEKVRMEAAVASTRRELMLAGARMVDDFYVNVLPRKYPELCDEIFGWTVEDGDDGESPRTSP